MCGGFDKMMQALKWTVCCPFEIVKEEVGLGQIIVTSGHSTSEQETTKLSPQMLSEEAIKLALITTIPCMALALPLAILLL